MRSIAEMLGVKLCECCFKENEEALKILADLKTVQAKERETKEMVDDIKEIKNMIKKNDNMTMALEKQSGQIQDLSLKLEEIANKGMLENQQMKKEWSSLFKDNVEVLSLNVGAVQRSVVGTIETNNKRVERQNNIVVYNLQENDLNSKAKDKEEILKLLKEVSSKDLDTEIMEFFRMGKRTDNAQRARPVLIKFDNQSTKNLVLENSFSLRKSESYKMIILKQDLSIEDREQCRKLLDDKKKEIGLKDDINKWVFRIRGRPGSFHVLSYMKKNL